MWSQTPQFDLLLDPNHDIGIDMNVHHGTIKSLDFKASHLSTGTQQDLRNALVGQKLQDIRDWTQFLEDRLPTWDERSTAVARRLDELMPIPALSMA